MTIAEELDQFRLECPGCRVVALADLSTRMVLAASTLQATAQEVLDELCDCAVKASDGPDIAGVSRLFGSNGSYGPTVSIRMSAEEVSCFVAAIPPASEALCMIFEPDAPLVAATNRASQFLERIAVFE